MALRVLVVEDDRDLQRNMKMLLESEGYDVHCAENGQAALSYLASAAQLPNVIILDLMMPIMDGFQFREAQEQDPRIKNIPVVIMTADGHIDEKKIRAKAEIALRKPADIDEILDVVKKAAG